MKEKWQKDSAHNTLPLNCGPEAMASAAPSPDQHPSVLKAQGSSMLSIWSELTPTPSFQTPFYPFLTERSQTRTLATVQTPSWHSVPGFILCLNWHHPNHSSMRVDNPINTRTCPPFCAFPTALSLPGSLSCFTTSSKGKSCGVPKPPSSRALAIRQGKYFTRKETVLISH